MSDSIKKYTEMYEEKLEEKMISKGFGEKDSHNEEHVMKVVCKHFDLEQQTHGQATVITTYTKKVQLTAILCM